MASAASSTPASTANPTGEWETVCSLIFPRCPITRIIESPTWYGRTLSPCTSTAARVVAAPTPRSLTARLALSMPSRMAVRIAAPVRAAAASDSRSAFTARADACSPPRVPPIPSATTSTPEVASKGINAAESSFGLPRSGQAPEKTAATPPAIWWASASLMALWWYNRA